jgi:hypothetical protein
MGVREDQVVAVGLLLAVKLVAQEQAVKEIVVALLLMFLHIEEAAAVGQLLRV